MTSFARAVVDAEDEDAASQLAFLLNGLYLAHHVADRLGGDPDAEQRALMAVEALLAPSPPRAPSRAQEQA